MYWIHNFPKNICPCVIVTDPTGIRTQQPDFWFSVNIHYKHSHVLTEISLRLRDETVNCRREGWPQCIKNNKILLIISVRRGSFPMYHHDVRDSTHFRQSGSKDHQFSNLDQNHRHFRVSRGTGLVIEPDLRSDNRILPIN